MVDELASLGHRDVVRLSPPGFGAPLPDGFGATVSEYRDWLIGELSQLDGPVDLVGHDWGGGHVVGVAMTRPDLIRSWVTDVIGIFEPDYIWHPLAKIWQTPGDGESQVEAMIGGSVEDRAARMSETGMTGAAGREIAAAQGPEMARAILALYRSAAQPTLAEIGRNLPAAAARPGLAIIATADDFVGTLDARHRGASRAGAQVAMLEGLGHWWMLEDPNQGARVLSEFLSQL